MISKIEKLFSTNKQLKTIFWLFCLACVPAYFLSALWMPIPLSIYLLVIAAAIAQVIAWFLLVRLMFNNKTAIKLVLNDKGRWLILLAGMALTIKLLLQLGSTHPALSKLAFGFRPIVIGYLHLVLLGVITIFILGYIISMDLIDRGKYFMPGIRIFITGIIVNEILLMLQGTLGLSYSIVPFINELLLIAALIMFSGILLFNINTHDKRSVDTTH